MYINPLNAELNPIRHLLALVGARHIVHVSRIKVKVYRQHAIYSLQSDVRNRGSRSLARNNKAISLNTTLYYSNVKSYMFRLYETTIIRINVSEVYKKEIV